MPNPPTLTIRLSQPDGTTYRLDLTSPDVGEWWRCAFSVRQLHCAPLPRACHVGRRAARLLMHTYKAVT